MRVFSEGSVWLVPPHRALVVPLGIEHDLTAVGRLELRTLYFQPGVVPGVGSRCRAIDVSPLLRELLLHSTRLGGLRRDDEHEANCVALLADLLDREPSISVELPLPADRRALALARRLLAEPGTQVPIDRLAQSVGASRRTIERAFVEETGWTLGRWHRRLRLLQAMELLDEGLAVTTVSLRMGYRSTSAFISAFKRLFGLPPGQWRSRWVRRS